MMAEPVSCPTIRRRNFVVRRFAGDRQVGLDPEQRAVGMQVPIDRDRAAGRELHALGADRFLMIRQPGDAEEHIGLVHAPELAAAVRAGEHPLADAVHRHLFLGHLAAIDQDAADRQVAVAVVGVVVDAQHRAVLELDARRALDVDEEGVDRILEPADLQMPPVERAVLDLRAVVIEHALLADPAVDLALVGEGTLLASCAPGHEQIARTAMHRHGVFRGRNARAGDDRLVIAGEEALLLADLGDAEGQEILPRRRRAPPSSPAGTVARARRHTVFIASTKRRAAGLGFCGRIARQLARKVAKLAA